MRRVIEIDALAPERQRNPDLLGERVVRRRLDDRPEVFAKAPHRRVIVLPAEDHVLGVVIHPRQLAEEVADVGADAEVVQLAGVDADAHWVYFT